jgi:hypothetical protein
MINFFFRTCILTAKNQKGWAKMMSPTMEVLSLPWMISMVNNIVPLSKNYSQFCLEGKTHLLELSKLAEKDPEFYKYLQENDRELLDFDPNSMEGELDDDSGDEKIQETAAPVLTIATIRKWQKALLEVRHHNCVLLILR